MWAFHKYYLFILTQHLSPSIKVKMRCPLLGNACFTPLSKPVSCENVSKEPCPRLVIFWAAGILQPADTCKMHPWQGTRTIALLVQGVLRQGQVITQAITLSKRKINQKFHPAAGFIKIAFSEGAWGQEMLRKGDIWRGRGSWMQNNTKARCGSCHCLAGCQAMEPAEIVDRKGSTGSDSF